MGEWECLSDGNTVSICAPALESESIKLAFRSFIHMGTTNYGCRYESHGDRPTQSSLTMAKGTRPGTDLETRMAVVLPSKMKDKSQRSIPQ